MIYATGKFAISATCVMFASTWIVAQFGPIVASLTALTTVLN